MRSLLLLTLTFLPAMGAETDATEIAIRQTRMRSNIAIRRRDVKMFAASLADDFLIVRGNSTSASRKDYLDAQTRNFSDPNGTLYDRATDKIEVSRAAPLAAEHGHWSAIQNDKRVYGGTYLAMWRLTESGWKIRSELFVLLTCEDAPACAAYRNQ